MNVWYTVIQCTIVLELSPNDTRPHPNTLPIRSPLKVSFWVFHPGDLFPFLIRLTRAFTFHHYFIFFLSFSISYTFHNFYPFFTQPWCKWMPQFQNFSIISTIPIFPIIQQNKFSTLKFLKISQQIFKNSHINKLEIILHFWNFAIILIISNIRKIINFPQ